MTKDERVRAPRVYAFASRRRSSRLCILYFGHAVLHPFFLAPGVSGHESECPARMNAMCTRGSKEGRFIQKTVCVGEVLTAAHSKFTFCQPLNAVNALDLRQRSSS